MDCNTMESNLKASIAKELLKIGAVFLRPDEPFTWASGIKSPIYCDNRLTLSYPKTREKIEKAFAQRGYGRIGYFIHDPCTERTIL